jgi:hypothetical protein
MSIIYIEKEKERKFVLGLVDFLPILVIEKILL